MVDAHIRGVKFSPCLKHSSMNADVQCRFKPYPLHNVLVIRSQVIKQRLKGDLNTEQGEGTDSGYKW